MFSKIRQILRLNFYATIKLNAHYFGMKGLLRLPILAYGKIELANCSGQIILQEDMHRGMIQLGNHILGIVPSTNVSIWQVSGCIDARGGVLLGSGTKLSVSGNLTFGKNVCITGNTTIICGSKLSIGDNSIISWDVLIMDNDQHQIKWNSKVTEMIRPIEIGKNVWVGCRAMILKGSTIPDNSVIAADSTVTKTLTEQRCIYGGKGSDLHRIKSNIDWKR